MLKRRFPLLFAPHSRNGALPHSAAAAACARRRSRSSMACTAADVGVGACAGFLVLPLCVHTPPPLLLLEAALSLPLLCCVFGAPTFAVFALGARHAVEWDEHDGKFVGAEEDTVLFDESGEVLSGFDLYDPRTDDEGAGESGEHKPVAGCRETRDALEECCSPPAQAATACMLALKED